MEPSSSCLSIDARMLFDTSNTIGYENKYIQIKCARQKFQDDYQDFMLAFHGEYTEYVKERSEIQTWELAGRSSLSFYYF